MSAALQIYSRDFDADFFRLPSGVQARIESSIDRLGRTLDTHPHHRMKGVDAYRIRVGDYRVIYHFNLSKAPFTCWRSATGEKFIANKL